MGLWLEKRVKAIKTCLESSFVEEALTLLYAATDTLAFLAAPADAQYTKREFFVQWCTQYIVPNLPAASGVTAVDLYGARCGVLHTSSAKSSLGQEGEAREVWYQYGGRVAVNLMTNTRRPALVLDVETLVSAFERGAQKFFADLAGDQSRSAIAEERAKQLFTWGTRLI